MFIKWIHFIWQSVAVLECLVLPSDFTIWFHLQSVVVACLHTQLTRSAVVRRNLDGEIVRRQSLTAFGFSGNQTFGCIVHFLLCQKIRSDDGVRTYQTAVVALCALVSIPGWHHASDLSFFNVGCVHSHVSSWLK